MENFKEWFACRLKNLRTQESMTQNDLAEITGIGIATIERLERGKVFPRIETCLLIAKVFGITVSQLLQEFDDNFDV